MTTPQLRTIETGGRLLALCGSREIQDMPTERLVREAGRAGLRITDCDEALQMLAQADLVRLGGDRLSLTTGGLQVARAMTTSWRAYCLELLGMAWVQEAAALALGFFDRGQDGSLSFDRERLVKLNPQLTAVLGWLVDDTTMPNVLGPDVVERLLVSAHLSQKQSALPPTWVQRAADVGLRAEYYSLHLERSRKPPAQVLHVAAESDRYGYDIEDCSVDPPTMIEVKGSTKPSVQFFITKKERQTAADNPERYLVHFWGQIDLERPMAIEYAALRAAGYPITLPRLVESIDLGALDAQPSEWWVVQPIGP